MRFLAGLLGFIAIGIALPAKSLRAYDIDCAILLCMAGGFPPSQVCSAAYAEMIRRITPHPVLPPFGICTYAAVPISLGGPGGNTDLDTSTLEYSWLRKTRIYWFWGYSYQPHDGERRWTWRVQSCDHENQVCKQFIIKNGSETRWPSTFLSENALYIPYPVKGGRNSIGSRAVMIEFGNFEGVMRHSRWINY